MRGETAATLPAAMATSRTALRWLRGSMTWPPRRSRSYLGSAARAEAARARHQATSRKVRSRGMTSASPRRAARRGPAAAQVLAQVEGPRHLLARHLPRERVGDGVARRLREGTAQADGVAVDGAGEVAGHEVAAVRPVDVVLALAEVEPVHRRARRVFHAHV